MKTNSALPKMKTENQEQPRIVLTNDKSSYSDGLSWVSISGLKEGNGIWLKPGERLAVLPPLPNAQADL